jgi:GT2 family glycosyltransferase
MLPYNLIISVVLYKNKAAEIQTLIDSVSTTQLNYKLYFIDNSPSDDLRQLAFANSIEYIFNDHNLGFGKAHNIALKKSVTIQNIILFLTRM